MSTILVADDEAIERMVLQKKIQKFFPECEVISAANGREVVEKYRESSPGVLVLDIEMPGKSGLQAAEEIRKENRDISIIFLTAFDEFSYAKRAISLHATDYLLKPCDDRELTAAVEEGLRVWGEHPAREEDRGSSRDRQETVRHDLSDRTGENDRGVQVQEEIRRYVLEHYSEDLSVQSVAGRFGYVDAYFCKIFKQYFGRSFVTFLSEYRIEKAKELLAESEMSVREIGRTVGYPDANYFAKVFKRICGSSPSEYRQKTI